MWDPGEHELVKRIDMSQFHMLDHWPFTKECRSFYGGGLRHLWLAWHFQRRQQVLRPVWRLFCCPWGRHHEELRRFTNREGKEHAEVGCVACGRLRLPSESELEKNPPIRFMIEEEDS
jgi:hypothetical protein